MNDRTACPVHDRCPYTIPGRACGYENTRRGVSGWRSCPNAKRLGADAAAVGGGSGDGNSPAAEAVPDAAALDAGDPGRDAGLVQTRLM